MSDDPTPKQSGSYAVMGGICHDSIADLHRWFLVCPPGAEGKVLFLMSRFKRLSMLVQAWLSTTTSESKQITINQIFTLRKEAEDLAKSYGHELSRR